MKYYWIEAYFGNEIRRIKFKTEQPLEDIQTMIYLGVSMNPNYVVFDNTIQKTNNHPKHLSGINLSRADEILVYPVR